MHWGSSIILLCSSPERYDVSWQPKTLQLVPPWRLATAKQKKAIIQNCHENRLCNSEWEESVRKTSRKPINAVCTVGCTDLVFLYIKMWVFKTVTSAKRNFKTHYNIINQFFFTFSSLTCFFGPKISKKCEKDPIFCMYLSY